ncbi:phage portal protein [uncultured Cetobacterium sp.]|uniref:phage portal protein n=1 Tax=uncultured Cetobacterium sp. TaxID=527638 RepID=UPI00261C1DAE|nr:phage portal protein [uncultured Cetobacterium sp.]
MGKKTQRKVGTQSKGIPQRQDFSNYSRSGASLVNKALMDINSFLNTPDEDISDNIDILKARSREMYMGNSVGIAAIRKIRTNSIGIGLKLKSTIDYKIIGISQEEAEELEDRLESLWEYWAESTECDYNRMKNFYQLQALAMTSKLVDGEAFAVMPYKSNLKEAFELKVRLLDSANCVSPNGSDSDTIVKGVETDPEGVPVAYYFARDKEKTDVVKVPIFGEKSGRRNIIHVFDSERIGQKRGIPLLSPLIEELHQITKVGRAELKNIAVSTIFSAFIKNESQETMLKGASKLGEKPAKEIPILQFDSGNFGELAPGQDIVFANPNRQYSPLDTFIGSIIKKIGAALEIPNDVLISYFNKSYSASRAALNEAWRTYLVHRQNFLIEFCNPIYSEFVDYLIDKKQIELKGYKEDLLKRRAYLSCEWIGSSPGQIDPIKEVRASIEKINNGLSTREREMKALGLGEYDKIQNQRKREVLNELKLEELKRKSRELKGGETNVVVESGKEKK